MALQPKRRGALILRLIVGLALLGWPRVGSAQGTWEVISLPQQPGEVLAPSALAVDAAGNLYVADQSDGGRIQKRDANGSWVVLASAGDAPGQVLAPTALAADAEGNLYVAERPADSYGHILRRDIQGSWSVIATAGANPGQVRFPDGLAVDDAGNLYVAEGYFGNQRIQKRDTQGHWSVIATRGSGVDIVSALAVDAAGNLYVADWVLDPYTARIRKRDVQGNWSVIATYGRASGQVVGPRALAVDTAGNLYVADYNQIQKRDTQGNWLVIATQGAALGQVELPSALAVEPAGNLYVASRGIQKRDAQGNWSVIAPEPGPGQLVSPSALAEDAAGNLYVMAGYGIEERDAQGHWSRVVTTGRATGQVSDALSLAVDAAGNLYVSEYGNGRVQERDAQGDWSVIAPLRADALAADIAGSLFAAISGTIWRWDGQGGDWFPIDTTAQSIDRGTGQPALAADSSGNLYVAENLGWSAAGEPLSRIRKRDGHGNWLILATAGTAAGQVSVPNALAADATGNLYVADSPYDSAAQVYSRRIQKRDAQGIWSVIAPHPGYGYLSGLAVDSAGNLYATDYFNNRVLKYTLAR